MLNYFIQIKCLNAFFASKYDYFNAMELLKPFLTHLEKIKKFGLLCKNEFSAHIKHFSTKNKNF